MDWRVRSRRVVVVVVVVEVVLSLWGTCWSMAAASAWDGYPSGRRP